MTATATVPMTMAEAKRAAIVAALRYSRGDRTLAAATLGIGYGTIYRKIREFDIEPGEYMGTTSASAHEEEG